MLRPLELVERFQSLRVPIRMLYRGVAVLLLLLCTSCTADSASKIAKLRQQLAEAEAEAAVQISETPAARLQSNSSWILDPEKGAFNANKGFLWVLCATQHHHPKLLIFQPKVTIRG